MPANTIVDIKNLNLDEIIISKEEILTYNPQRYEFEQVDSIVKLDLEEEIIVGVKKQKDEDFWTRGHIPGRPLMPGVLMIEMAAQICSILYLKKMGASKDKFFGFGGVDKVKFRSEVKPGNKLAMCIKSIAIRSRMARFEAQAFVGENMVFQGEITGVII